MARRVGGDLVPPRVFKHLASLYLSTLTARVRRNARSGHRAASPTSYRRLQQCVQELTLASRCRSAAPSRSTPSTAVVPAVAHIGASLSPCRLLVGHTAGEMARHARQTAAARRLHIFQTAVGGSRCSQRLAAPCGALRRAPIARGAAVGRVAYPWEPKSKTLRHP